MDFWSAIKLGGDGTGRVKSFECSLVELSLAFAVFENADKLTFKLGVGVLGRGPISVLVIQ